LAGATLGLAPSPRWGKKASTDRARRRRWGERVGKD